MFRISCAPRRPAISDQHGKLQTPEDGASTSAAAMPCPQERIIAEVPCDRDEMKGCRHRKMARAPAPQPHWSSSLETLKRIHQPLVGKPSHGLSSTTPSWRHSSLPSNWQIRHRNHTVVRWSRSVTHTRHLPDSDSLCHVLCSTKLSWALTTLPANSRIRLRNCTDRLVLLGRVELWGQRGAVSPAGWPAVWAEA